MPNAVDLACFPAWGCWQNGKRVLITRINLVVSGLAGASGTCSGPLQSLAAQQAMLGLIAMPGKDFNGNPASAISSQRPVPQVYCSTINGPVRGNADVAPGLTHECPAIAACDARD
jgi:hypothetical protein